MRAGDPELDPDRDLNCATRLRDPDYATATTRPQLRDPNYATHADSWWQSVWSGLELRQPARNEGDERAPERSDDPNLARAATEGALLNLAYDATLTHMAWSGHAIESALPWWLPRHIGYTSLLIFPIWAPHHRATGTGRCGDTRAWKSPLRTLLFMDIEGHAMGTEDHVVHQLFPKIPLFQTAPAYWAMRDLLIERGIHNDVL